MPQNQRIHFIGIGGAGMSAIARVLLAKEIKVTGSDVEETSTTRGLRDEGAVVFIGHRAEHVDGADLVVVTTAIPPDNPEAARARALGVPVKHRSEMLAELLNERDGVAIAGAHGKTTITSMTSWCLVKLGFDPTFLIGGHVAGLGGARAGGGSVLVAEADESDRSFLRYRPYVGLISSIEPDHLEYYDDDFGELKGAYAQFARNVKDQGVVVLCIDDPNVRALLEARGSGAGGGRPVSYGHSPDARYTAAAVQSVGFTQSFRLVRDGTEMHTFCLSIPGRHNVQNALGVIAVCDFLGADLRALADAMVDFRGAKRRFQVVAEKDGVLYIDDYAHHPTEIRATLAACRSLWDGRIVAVFQPHRYSRTAHLMAEFSESFYDADIIVLTDVYAPPPEMPIPGVSGERLAALTRRRSGEKVRYAPTLQDASEEIRRLARPGDLVVTMGAGNVWKVAYDLGEVAVP